MSKGIYVGIEDKARKVKKAYTGIENKARKIKKGYIGVGGVARPLFSSEPELTYYGELELLDFPGPLVGTSLGNYAVFLRGYYDGPDFGGRYAEFNAYDANLINHSSGEFTDGFSATDHAVPIGNYALFPHTIFYDELPQIGTDDILSGPEVPTLDVNLTRGTADGFIELRTGFGGASNKNYALFYGGSMGPDVSSFWDAYDKNLTHTFGEIAGPFTEATYSASLDNYAVFCEPWENVICAFDVNLTQHAMSPLYAEEGRDVPTGIGFNNHAIFAGGEFVDYRDDVNRSHTTSVIDVYDENLVKCPNLELSSPKMLMGAVVLDNHLIFAGGRYFAEEDSNVANYEYKYSLAEVDVFDSNFVRHSGPPLKAPRDFIAGAIVDKYALFAGGCTWVQDGNDLNNEDTDIVEAYTFL